MAEKLVRLVIITARNLRTTSDCSPETILNILENIDPKKYTVEVLLVDSLIPEMMRVTEQELIGLPMYIPFAKVLDHPLITRVINIDNITVDELRRNYDFAVVAVYNDFGEDGKLLGMLDVVGLPYLSPSLKVSAVCFDKGYTKALLTYADVDNPRGFVLHHDRCTTGELDEKIVKKLNYPVVVKPTSSGNSWGVSIVRTKDDLVRAIDAALMFADELLVEQYIEGQEFTVGVVGHYLHPVVLPVVMISHQEELFDYRAKYTVGKSEEICPAPISLEITQRLQAAATSAYRAVKADSHVRIDMILGLDGRVYVLDINTFPGLNRASLFPKELRAAGKTLGKFIDDQVKKKLSRK